MRGGVGDERVSRPSPVRAETRRDHSYADGVRHARSRRADRPVLRNPRAVGPPAAACRLFGTKMELAAGSAQVRSSRFRVSETVARRIAVLGLIWLLTPSAASPPALPSF